MKPNKYIIFSEKLWHIQISEDMNWKPYIPLKSIQEDMTMHILTSFYQVFMLSNPCTDFFMSLAITTKGSQIPGREFPL